MAGGLRGGFIFQRGFWINFSVGGGVTHSSDASARNVIPSACIRFKAAMRPRFLRAVSFGHGKPEKKTSKSDDF